MDSSQLHLAYSNKKLPCDLPKKESKSSIPEPEQEEQEMEQQISDAISSIDDVDELSDVFTITTTTTRKKREKSENSAFRKSTRNQKVPDPDPDMLISDKQLHFVHNDNAIIVTSFHDAGLSALQDGSTEVSGLPSGSGISGDNPVHVFITRSTKGSSIHDETALDVNIFLLRKYVLKWGH